jgi:hypothetical protein
MKNKIINLTKVAVFITLIVIIIYFAIKLESEPHNYEIHAADGKVYHTTDVRHGEHSIWFTDENGKGIELGGGYTVIRIK